MRQSELVSHIVWPGRVVPVTFPLQKITGIEMGQRLKPPAAVASVWRSGLRIYAIWRGKPGSAPSQPLSSTAHSRNCDILACLTLRQEQRFLPKPAGPGQPMAKRDTRCQDGCMGCPVSQRWRVPVPQAAFVANRGSQAEVQGRAPANNTQPVSLSVRVMTIRRSSGKFSPVTRAVWPWDAGRLAAGTAEFGGILNGGWQIRLGTVAGFWLATCPKTGHPHCTMPQRRCPVSGNAACFQKLGRGWFGKKAVCWQTGSKLIPRTETPCFLQKPNGSADYPSHLQTAPAPGCPPEKPQDAL